MHSKVRAGRRLTAAFVAALLACVPVAAQQNPAPFDPQAPVSDAQLGVPITVPAKLGVVTLCRVRIRKGEYIRIDVEQDSTSLKPEIRSVDGTVIAAGNTLAIPDLRLRAGIAPIGYIAAADGEYLVTAYVDQIVDPKAIVRVLVAERRDPTPADREYIATLDLVTRAMDLMNAPAADSKREGLAMMGEAADRFKALGLAPERCAVVFWSGLVQSHLGRYGETIRVLEESAVLARELREKGYNAETELMAYLGIATSYRSAGEPLKSLETVDLALALPVEFGWWPKHLLVLERSKALRDLGDQESSAAELIRVAEILEDQKLSGTSYRDMARRMLIGVESAPADLQNSFARAEYFRKQKLIGNLMNELNGLGYCYLTAAEYQGALDTFEEARAVSRDYGYRMAECAALSAIGLVHHNLGASETAIGYYTQALGIAREMKYYAHEGEVLERLSLAYDALRALDGSLVYAKEALALHRRHGSRTREAYPQLQMGSLYARKGDTVRAVEAIEAALAIHRQSKDGAGEAWDHYNLGTALAREDASRATPHFEVALARAQSIGLPKVEMAALYELAAIDRDRGDLTRARQRIEQAIARVEASRVNVRSRELRVAYFSSVRRYYDLYIDILMRQGTKEAVEEALRASERARARVLLEMLAEQSIDLTRGADPALQAREVEVRRRLAGKLDYQVRLAGRAHEAAEEVALRKEIGEIERDLDGVRAELRAKHPAYAALTAPEAVTVERMQRELLDGQTALVEYALGERRSWMWAVTTTGVVTAELPARAEIEARAGRVRDLLVARSAGGKNEMEAERAARIRRADADYERAARELSEMVLGPVAKAIAGKRLAIVADGALQMVPFDALKEPGAGGRWLVEGHEVVMLPSATALETLRRQTARRASAPGAIAVLADPVFEPGDPRVAASARASSGVPLVTERVRRVMRSVGVDERDGFARLEGSRSEAKAIERLVSRGQSLVALDFGANLDLATGGKLSEYRIVHFATHGYVPAAAPELSGLVLSLVDETGAERAGYLGLSEIYGLKLSAELVVLSACETGLGRQVRGEGVVGLTRGFMYAGSRRVMASLWKVDDRPTSELMERVYRRMLAQGRTPSAALREAKLELLRAGTWKAPYYWAAFQLYGEWR